MKINKVTKIPANPWRCSALTGLAVYALTCIAPSKLQANLLLNGSFETPDIAPFGLTFQTPTGWTGLSQMLDLPTPTGDRPAAQEGTQYVDLNLAANGFTGLQQLFTVSRYLPREIIC